MAQHVARLQAEGDVTGVVDDVRGLGQVVSTSEGSLTIVFFSDLDASDLFEWAKSASSLGNCSWTLSIQERGGGKLLMK